MKNEKLTKFLFSATLITWFFYAFATPFLVLMFESYASFLYLIEYILIGGYIGIAAVMIYTLRYSVWAYRFNMRLQHQWQHTPEAFTLQDVSNDNKKLSNQVALDYKKQVEALRFRRLGETENSSYVNYVFTNEDNSVKAVVRPRKPDWVDMFFTTVFADGFFLITGYECLMNFDVDGLQQRRVNESIEKAYNYHLQQLEMHRLQRGEPVQIDAIEPMLNYGLEYSKRYFEFEVRIASKICIISLVFSVLMEVSLLIGIYGLLHRDVLLTSIPMGVLLTFIYLFMKFLPEIKPVDFDKRKHRA